jgi:predicted N-acetyltransferase YhbS
MRAPPITGLSRVTITIPAFRRANSVAPITIRLAQTDDAEACGQILYEAFYRIQTAHGFPMGEPTHQSTSGRLAKLFSHPGYYCIVAEVDGRVVGSNCLDERAAIFGVGPVTIDPADQNRGIGRLLMEAVLERAQERNAAGVRLVHATFHGRALALYATLGFEVREPLAVMNGEAIRKNVDGCAVRSAKGGDLLECIRTCRDVHGFDRGEELSDAIQGGAARVVERQGRITGYASSIGFFGHMAGETNLDVQALIAAADGFDGPGILVPTRNTALLRWCLANGLRFIQPMTLMTHGLYNEPVGGYLPSVTF